VRFDQILVPDEMFITPFGSNAAKLCLTIEMKFPPKIALLSDICFTFYGFVHELELSIKFYVVSV
jgi:hypothetical protein